MYPCGQSKLRGGPSRLARLLIWSEATGVEAASVAVVVDGGNVVDDSEIIALLPRARTTVDVGSDAAVVTDDPEQYCGSRRTLK